jgi:hypothetical protein
MEDFYSSLGEKRIRTNEVNAWDGTSVQMIKAKAAEFINYIESLPTADREGDRYKELAVTAIEEAALWGVKLATL